jgi:DNA (cytosine-5)-methyltransferase 1
VLASAAVPETARPSISPGTAQHRNRSDSVDIVAGGPPCQGFSEVVSPDGSDERNHLSANFVNWVNELRPEAALFENVRGMKNTAGGEFLEAVEESFDRISYEVTHRVVTSSDFGVPRHRRRLVVLATKEGRPAHSLDGVDLAPSRRRP